MDRRASAISFASAAALAVFVPSAVDAQVRVQLGRITDVQATTVTDQALRKVETLVGGGIGLGIGSGPSGKRVVARSSTRGASTGRPLERSATD
jgi:hypothetical protein